MNTSSLSRRSFVASAAAAAATPALWGAKKTPPVGLELYSVRQELAKDLFGTVKQVAKMGYQGVEFYSPYFDWTIDYAKDVRKLLDSEGLKCWSTHNGNKSFAPETMNKAIELNGILGSKMIVLASAGRRIEKMDDWKLVAEALSKGDEKFRAAGMRAGYHNHQVEFKPVDGTRPLDIIAKNTPESVVLQLDVGTCVEVGQDPVAWIKANKGRVACIHCKEYSKTKGYKVAFSEGDSPWAEIFKAAEKNKVEFYLIEQEGGDKPAPQMAEDCLNNYKKFRKL